MCKRLNLCEFNGSWVRWLITIRKNQVFCYLIWSMSYTTDFREFLTDVGYLRSRGHNHNEKARFARTWGAYVYMHTHICMNMYNNIDTYIGVYMYIYIYVCIYYIYAYMYYVFIHVYIHTYIDIYIWKYTYLHTHINLKYISIYTYVYICTYIHMYIYIYFFL